MLGSLFLIGSSAFAQVTIPYSGGDIDATSYDTTAPNNPTNLTIATGGATQSGVIFGSGSVGKTGAGILTLTAANTYSGGTTLSAGTLVIGNDSAFGTGTLTIEDGAILGQTTGTKTLANNLVINGDFTRAAAPGGGAQLHLNGNVDLGGSNRTLNMTSGDNIRFFGSISNGGITFSNANIKVSFNGSTANTYTGTTTVQGGTLGLQKDPGVTSIAGDLVIDSGATVNQSDSNQIADTSTVTVNGSYGLINSSETFQTLMGSGTINLENFFSQTLTIQQGSFSGTIEDSGDGSTQLIKTGTGTLTLSGANSYTGTTSINAGTLLVNGSLGSTAVAVNNGGLLGGSGTLGGTVTVQSGGILSPGNSTGILTISGDLNLNAGSITRMEINGTTPGTGHDQIVVGGTATLGGNLEVFFGGGLSGGDTFTLIDAANPIVGDFANVINVLGNALSFTTAVTGDHDLTITAVQNNFVPFALAPNQTQIAQTIDELALSGDLNGLINFLNTLPGTSLPAAFDQLAPTQFAFLASSAFSNSRFQLGDLSSQMGSRRGGSSGLAVRRINVSTAGQSEFLRPAADESWSVFASATGRFSEIDGDINGAGYDSDSGGLLLGADLKTSDSFILGLYAGYDHTELDFGQNGGGIDSDSAKYGLYGTWFNESGSWVEGVLGGGYHDYKSTRRVLGANATSDTRASEFLLSLITGHDFRFGQREQWLLTPSVGLSYNRLKTDAFTEQGSLAPLTLSDQTAESLQGQISLRLANRSEWAGYKWLSYVDCGWRQEFFDRSQSIDARFAAGGGLFTVNGPSVSRGTATFGAGVNALLSDSLSVGLGYSGEFNSDIQVNQVNASVRISF